MRTIAIALLLAVLLAGCETTAAVILSPDIDTETDGKSRAWLDYPVAGATWDGRFAVTFIWLGVPIVVEERTGKGSQGWDLTDIKNPVKITYEEALAKRAQVVSTPAAIKSVPD